jgi:MerR family transcriptional regulator, light-induced transcriptional regulator
MAGLLPRSGSRAAAPGPRCVVLPVSGESHLIGARMVADLLAIAGVTVRFLGAHLAIGHVREMLVANPPDLLALSVTLPSNLNTAADTIRSLREKRVLSGMRILVGGQAFEAAPALGRKIGADAVGRDAEEAVRLAQKLLAEKD